MKQQMVNKMKPLIKLKILKTKGSIRELFENKAAGIIIIFTGLIYLLGLGTMIGNTSASMQNNPLVNIMILIYIGFLAILIFSTFMSSRKALFFGEDAFYLFTGPFTKTQIMTYLTFQNLSQSLYLTLVCFMIFVFFSTIVTVSLGFMILTAVVSMIAFFCFLILSDYLYVLSIGDRKYRKYSKIIPAIIIILVLVVVGLVYLQTGDYNNLLLNLIKSDLFYVIPIFGWIRLILVSFIEQNFLITLLTFLLLLITTVLIYYAFIKYQGDFYEQALQYLPNDAGLLNNYAYTLATTGGDLKKAERMSQATINKDPENPIYLDTYAWILYLQGYYSLSKIYIEQALKYTEKDDIPSEYWEHYGYILFKLDKPSEAIEAWKKAIASGSENQEIIFEIEQYEKNQ